MWLNVIVLFITLCESKYSNCDPSDYYEGVDLTLTGTSLERELHQRVKGHHVLSYNDAWYALVRLDAGSSAASVRLIYASIDVPASLSGIPSGWNREHMWPKSYGVGFSGPDFSDLMHLRPSDWNVNSARGNLYFDACSSSNVQCTSPAHPEAATSTAKSSTVFQPPASVRGDIARAMFYMAVRYDGTEAYTDNLTLSSCPCAAQHRLGDLNTLLEWHREDPVDSTERNRNQMVCSDFQGNRNPFVDHPQLVDQIWSASSTDCSTVPCSATPVPVQNPVLAPGSVVLVGFEADNPDTLSLGIMVSLPAGTRIHVTDASFDGSSFSTSEGRLTFTVPDEGIEAGSTVVYDSSASPFWSKEGQFALSVSGEALYVYTGARQSPQILFALSYDTAGWAASGRPLPSTLQSGKTALVLPHQDNYRYSGPLTGTRAELLAAICSPSSWTGSSETRLGSFEGEFSITAQTGFAPSPSILAMLCLLIPLLQI